MSSLPLEIVAAAALFAGTNIDDIVVLALLSATSQATGRPSRWQLWGGQYVGFTLLTGTALAAGRGLASIPEGWLWPVALVPIALGFFYLARALRAVRRGERPAAPSAGGLAGVAMLTIVNGSDSLAAYAPFFATSGWGQIMLSLAVFAASAALWDLASWRLVSHKKITAAVSHYAPWILPAVFILIGLWTLHATGALA
jgi:cadmium resistance protein CadD (predicted permease)